MEDSTNIANTAVVESAIITNVATTPGIPVVVSSNNNEMREDDNNEVNNDKSNLEDEQQQLSVLNSNTNSSEVDNITHQAARQLETILDGTKETAKELLHVITIFLKEVRSVQKDWLAVQQSVHQESDRLDKIEPEVKDFTRMMNNSSSSHSLLALFQQQQQKQQQQKQQQRQQHQQQQASQQQVELINDSGIKTENMNKTA